MQNTYPVEGAADNDSMTVQSSKRSESAETLLAGRSYRPAFRIKTALFSLLPFLRAVYSFNPYRREKWVKQQAAKLAAGSQVVDIGAGTCPYRKLFSHCRYIAHDLAKLQDHQLQTRSGYGNLDLVSDITDIPIETATVDAILCTEVLEHVPDPAAAVKEMSRLLRPGGLLLLTAPLRSGLHQMPYHFYSGYTPSWYQKFLSENRFTDVKITPVCGLLNAFGEESLYVFIYLSPFSNLRLRLKVLLFPVWILGFPIFALLPPICWALDSLALGQEFTLGYFVEARKA